MEEWFSHLIGNERIKNQLIHMVKQKALGHALLFVGLEGIGKSLFAHALIQLILSQEKEAALHLAKLAKRSHPDVHHYYPEGKLGIHSIQMLRELNQEIQLPPYESKWKVFVIHEADRMLSYSANALLKTFEEPPPFTLIILLSSLKSALLTTLLSRCFVVSFQPIESFVIKNFLALHFPDLESKLRSQIVHQAQGSIGQAKRLAEQKGDPYRLLILNFLAYGLLRNYSTLQKITHQLSSEVEENKKKVEEWTRKELYNLPIDYLSSQQQQAMEKELEGWVNLAYVQEVEKILEHVLSWYRDLHYLLMGGETSQLINEDFDWKLKQIMQQGNCLAIEKVNQAVEEAHISLKRSTHLSLCLENLFLKLGCVI